MRYLFKTLKLFCLSIFLLLLSLSALAVPTGEVFCIHHAKILEVWSSDVTGHNAHMLFKLPLIIMDMSIQEDGRRILVVGERVNRVDFDFDGENENNAFGINAYLLDRYHGGKDILYGKNLTLNMYGEVIDADMSPEMDIILTNSPYRDEHFAPGLYLIPEDELNKHIPKAKKLFKGQVFSVDFSPNGRDIVFSTKDGIFRMNLAANGVTKIAQKGILPVFSPDGRKIVFVTKDEERRLIHIYTLSTRKQKVFKIITDHYVNHLTWSGDGKFIAYTLRPVIPQKVISYSNFAASIYDGKPVPILTTFKDGVLLFEWAHTSLPVDPANLLTTTWGQLKTQDQK